MTMVRREVRIAAAAISIGYIAIQGFQEYVYRTLPATQTSAEELLQGGEPLHVARSAAMLFAILGAVFVYATLAVSRIRARPVAGGVALACFYTFGLLELGLRSVELFWAQLQLPAAYAASQDPAILDRFTTFQAVQGALYFPLQLAGLIGSIAMVWLARPPPRIDRVLQVVFVFNAARIAARMLTSYAQIPLLPTDIYEQIYMVFVVAIHGPIAYWLARVR